MEKIRSRYDNAIFETKYLSNGIPVHLQRPQMVPDYGGILIAFLPGVGSVLETDADSGIAHFFEHVPFDDTRLNAEILRMGGERNGSTSSMRTEYTVNGTPAQFSLIADDLYRIVAAPDFSEHIVLRERGVITKEYERVHADPDYYLSAALRQSHLEIGHPLVRDSIGTVENIRNMTGDQLERFYQEHYHAGNIQLICGGAFADLSDEYVLNTLEQLFGKIPTRARVVLPDIRLPVETARRIERVSGKQFGRSLLNVSRSANRKLIFPEQVALGKIVSYLRSKTGPLWQQLRLERGWVYESGFAITDYMPGSFALNIQARVDEKHFQATEDIFHSALANMTLSDAAEQINWSVQQRWVSSSHPIGKCRRLLEKIAFERDILGDHESESVADTVTPEDVLVMRDYLLALHPVVTQIVAE